MRVRVKICGLTNVEDARVAVAAGADALGFVFSAASARHVTAARVAEIGRHLPPFVSRVGVFVNAPAAELRAIAAEAVLDTVQLHGDESPAVCAQCRPLRVYKAFRLANSEVLSHLSAYATDAWLLDSYVAGEQGGTGAAFNWDWAVEAGKLGRPIILAGGLTAANVGAAIRRVRPYAVDVSSGVESAPGRKDPRKVWEFMAAVAEAGSQVGHHRRAQGLGG
jgi:phosphoribosylanthranilate isomerase